MRTRLYAGVKWAYHYPPDIIKCHPFNAKCEKKRKLVFYLSRQEDDKKMGVWFNRGVLIVFEQPTASTPTEFDL